MNNMNRRLQLIEQFGLHMVEEHTMSRMSGRVLASLLLSTDSIHSIDSLTEDLRASRGAISMAIKDLTRLGLAEKVSRTGERKFYYRLRPDLWSKLYLEQIENIEEHVRLAKEGLRLLADEPREKKERLLEMGAFFQFLLEMLPQVAERWHQRGPELMEALEQETRKN